MNERVVLIEFDNLDKALACHDMPAYKEALKALGSGNVERDMRVVEGAAWSSFTTPRTDNASARRRLPAARRPAPQTTSLKGKQRAQSRQRAAPSAGEPAKSPSVILP
jgi:Domain of unknown function (DUF1330)